MQKFPREGNVRAKQCAKFLGIGLSTFWFYVKNKKIKKPVKHGARTSVWQADYIRNLAEKGILSAGSLPK